MRGPAIANHEMRRAARLLENMLDEAAANGVTDSPAFQRIVYCFAGMVAFSPLVASGNLVTESEARAPQTDITPFFEGNEWIRPYITSLILSLNLLTFVGRPWLPKYWLPAFAAAILFKYGTAENGTVKLVYKPDSVEEAISEIPSVDPRKIGLSGPQAA